MCCGMAFLCFFFLAFTFLSYVVTVYITANYYYFWELLCFVALQPSVGGACIESHYIFIGMAWQMCVKYNSVAYEFKLVLASTVTFLLKSLHGVYSVPHKLYSIEKL